MIGGVVLMIFLATIFILSIIRYQNKERKYHDEKKALNDKFSKTLLQSRLEIKEQTLQQIGYELHDNLGQVASLIKIHLNLLSFEDEDTAKQEVDNIKELTKQLIMDIKQLSISLNSERVVQLGISKGLEFEVEQLKKIKNFQIKLTKPSEFPDIDSNTTIILYRMIQEILNNTIKYSKAKRISIDVTKTEKKLTLVFNDDGIGFDLKNKLKEGGSGLINLNTRARLINADFKIKSKIDEGTTIIIEVQL
ncbi:ATP-binding protein [Aquimarina sp. MMG016]|uniref:sensor histidine kinase n=1 Tax=Aquimarina sp. MMG016 TaxID=2822690 RepID=UPI001B39D649|nr:hypothetical protein [Aquimarina sp. MMG016]